MDNILKELENYQSHELFLNYLDDPSTHNYHLIVGYLTTIPNSIKIDVFRDWFERYLSNMIDDLYINLIKKLYNDKHLTKAILLEIYDMSTLEYINSEAPNIYIELNKLLN
jgi:hypothetical protein